MAGKGLFASKGGRGYAISRRQIRAWAALASALGVLGLYYRAVLQPRFTARQPPPLGQAPELGVQQQLRPAANANIAPEPGRAQAALAPLHDRASRDGRRAQRPQPPSEAVPDKDPSGAQAPARKRPKASQVPPQSRDRPATSQHSAPPSKPEKAHTAVPAKAAAGHDVAAGPRGQAHAPPFKAEGPSEHHRHHEKERIMDSDMEKASAVVDALLFPRTEKWNRRAPRIIVSKAASSHKNLKSKAYLEILPDKDMSPGHHDTCAVVGNGGVMLSKEWGRGIDKHDAVFRFNDGPTTGFEKYVGSKTTYRLINNKWSKFYVKKHPRGALEENIVLFGNGAVGQAVHLAQMWTNEKVLLMAPEFAGQARGQYKHGQAALSAMHVVQVHGRNSAPTGIEGIFMALAACKKVHLYGFGIDTDPKIPYHYHDKVKGVEAAHSFGFQALLLKLLNFKGIFGLCVPGYDKPDCLDPSSSELGDYETAVVKMAASAAANPVQLPDDMNEDAEDETE